MTINSLQYSLSALSPMGTVGSAVTAYQLARKSLLQKNLRSLDDAVTGGNLSDIQRAYKTLTANNPQYTAGPASDLEDPITAGFRSLDKAVSQGSLADAQKAWKTLTSEFEKKGIALDSGNETAAQAKAQLMSYGSQSLMVSWQTYSSSGALVDGLWGNYSAGSFLSAFA